MSVTIAELLQCLPSVFKAKTPVLITGAHGCGKSELFYQLAEQLKMTVVERRASQLESGDVIGMPDKAAMKSRKCTVFVPPDWLDQACREPVLLFLDEIDRCTPEVSQALFELCDSRKIAGHKLHEGTIIAAAANGSEENNEYLVRDLDPAEVSRWTIFRFAPTKEEFFKHCKDKNRLHHLILDFLMTRPDMVEYDKTFEPNKKYPDRRSWVRCSAALVASEALENEESIKHNTTLIRNIVESYVGFECSVSFCDHLKCYKFQLDPLAILNDPEIVEKTKNLSLSENLTLIEKAELQHIWNTLLTPPQVKNVSDYLRSLPVESAMKLYHSIGAFQVPEELDADTMAIRVNNAEEIMKVCDEYFEEIMNNKELMTTIYNSQK